MIRALLLALALLAVVPAMAFDLDHTPWDGLLHKHVRVLNGGSASRVDYAGMLWDKSVLDAYTAGIATVSRAEFESWSRPNRMAFLIDAYNAETVALILSRYPDLHSIRDIGLLPGSAWKKDFFGLFGQRTSLDQVEGMLRAPGVYDDPRIHFALNCASIGCPMLRPEAYVGARLDDQLDEAMRRFLSDRSRNRYDGQSGELQVSKIFDWYAADFSQGRHGYTGIAQTLAQYANQLADRPEDRQRIRGGQVPIRYLPYDWGLNDAAR